MQPEEAYTLEEGGGYGVRVGRLRLSLGYERGVCRLAYRYGSRQVDLDVRPGAAITGPPEEVVVQDILLRAPARSFSLLPALPDKPLILFPEAPLRIFPGDEHRIFFHIPLWVRLVLYGESYEHTVLDLPPMVFSNTWSGSPESGVLGYSFRTRVMTEPEARPAGMWALCGVALRNRTQGELLLERLVVPVAFLSLYRGGDRLTTSRASLSFRGETGELQWQFERGAPGYTEGEVLVSGPREKAARNIFVMGVSLIRSLTGF
ncbi:DUF432 domain-containing protein [Spirochaeta thermophila]|uniref:DUF432 domain-containing protein n=1 Tax=Winmispira thermophila (strain ATCC 49972 / DSM 6192 / RI 19.B1) TaxID=665571 RepID=E0RPJ5_WINT6|nr:DUF432 domain-containing protein [Spirochaeta thermophila]ADN02777.1 hypothetical protein STHERM_c18420 [Spirochaeta thermophila DSM 6192]